MKLRIEDGGSRIESSVPPRGMQGRGAAATPPHPSLLSPRSSVSRSILIMAGGTGGHIFPALAVADILRSRGWRVTWLGAPLSMEAELVPRHGYDMAWVRFSGVRGKGLLRKLLLPFNLLVALWQSTAAILRHRPD